ncbi:MAG: hypothetical protein ACXV8Q_03325 [Methylobacter sp.]
MISCLREFDNVTAAGILARAALSLSDQGNPAAATSKLTNEIEIRNKVISNIRNTLGIKHSDTSPMALERIGDALDIESEALIGEPNINDALERLSNKGELPSDLFEVDIIPNIKDFFTKRFDAERELIEKTIKSPDNEQHFGPPSNSEGPYLISLFSKFFPNKYPRNSFTMLVAGERNGLNLTVHQAWRIYPDLVNLNEEGDLVDMLNRFADKFGAEIEFNGKKGHFFLNFEIPENDHWQKITFPAAAPNTRNNITLTYCMQPNLSGPSKKAALLVAIDLVKYRKTLKSRGW